MPIGDPYTDAIGLWSKIASGLASLANDFTALFNGTAMSPVQIDTSQAATDTIDYVATDQNGLTSTSTRTVIIVAPSIVPTDDAASSTAATTTAATSTSS